MEYLHTYQSPLGMLTLTADETGLTGLYLREPTVSEALLPRETDRFSRASAWLDSYFRGEQPDPDGLTLSPKGTPFRQLIWSLLRQIPYGQVRTYGQLAAEAARLLGKERMSAQAVGGAVGHNPISIIVPCHRVVAAGNQLGGFGWGPDAKIWLLNHEGGHYDHK